MNTESRKLNMIERFLKFQDDADLTHLEDVLTRLEIQMRIRASESDMDAGRVRSYDRFRTEVKAWMENQKNTK